MQSAPLQGFRLSHQQRRWWLLHREGPGRHALAAVEARLAPDAGEERLRRALAEVVDRHPVLRTSFLRRAGLALPIQVVAEDVGGPGWEEDDLTGLPPAEQEARWEALWQAAGEEPLDLEAVPALRVRCARLAAGHLRLILALPALCADEATLALLAGEIAASWAAPRGRDEELVSYVQVSEWQYETVDAASDGAAEAAGFWREQAAPDPLRLPGQRDPGAAAGGTAPLRVGVPIAAGTAAALSRAAEAAGAPLAGALLAGWAALLGRLGGRGEVAVAVESDGRGLEDLAGVLGPLARALPVRLDIRAGRSFAAAVAASAAALDEAADLEQHWVPEPRRDRTALDPGFACAWGPEPFAAAGLELRLTRCQVSGDPRPLTLHCEVAEGSLAAVLKADPAAFDRADVERLAAGLGALLAAAAAAPGTPLEALPVLPPAERESLIGGFNATASPVPEPLFVHRLIAAQAARHPGREALRCGGEVLTYGELMARSNRLARHLRSLGAGPETVVALALPRGVEMVVALLAVLQAGGAYLPVDAHQPAERLARMLEDGGAALVVGAGAVAAAAGPRHVDLERDAAAIAAWDGGGPAGPETVAADPDHLAYVIFTSGSTGRPKGVAVPHRQLASYVHGLRERLALGDGASFAMVSTFAADLGNTSLFGALCGGGCLHVIPEARVLDGEALADSFAGHPVDVLKIVPSHFQALYRSCSRPALLLPRRALVLGGEAFPRALAGELSAAAPHLALVNHYGPTEATVGCAACRLEELPEGAAQAAATVPIGRPLANARLYVLDAGLEPVPAGIPGELWVGGAGVARGYLGQSAQTAERFLPDPFAGVQGARMYRTGDRARHLPGAGIEHLGRLDRQVKVRGFRVEPDEVALALREHPGVEAAVVVPAEEPEGGVRLVAYTVPRRRWAAEIDGRRRHALPNGMAIVHQNRNETEYLYEEIFVRRTYAQHGIRLREEAVVLDLGANIGMFTLFVAACRPRARIYACEPLPPLYRTLRLNAELHAPQARVLPVGVADVERTAEFTFYPQHTMMSGLTEYSDPELERRVVERSLRNAQEQGSAEAAVLLGHADELLGRRFEGEPHLCRLRRVSDILREEGIEHVDLLKLDVQRAELDVLRALDAADWERIDQIVMELHQEEGGATAGRVAQVVALLAEHGFTAVVEQDPLLVGTDRYALYAWRPDRPARGEELATLAELAAAAAGSSDGGVLAAAGLRAWLSHRLPEPMCPAQHVLLKALPLTRNGKVNLAALPAPEQARAAGEGYVAPRNPLEERIAAIWAETLRVERVGVHDNYFELGGDSMQSIRVIARAARAGIRLTAQHFFEHQTVAALAAALSAVAAAGGGPAAEPGSGEVPLTPVQRRFLASGGAAGRGLPLALAARGEVDAGLLAAAFAAVVEHHGALRLRFLPDGDGWRQAHAEAAAPPAPEWLDLAAAPSVEAAAERLRAGLDPSGGPVVRLAVLRRGPGLAPILLLACHPLVADETSWRFLIEDLGTAYRALERGEPVLLPGRTQPFRLWAERQAAAAGPAAVPAEGGGTPATVALDLAETAALAAELAPRARAEVAEVLLLAVAEACGERRAGLPPAILVERDGREAADGLDVSRTVGCFTVATPCHLRVPAAGDMGERLRAVKEQVRAPEAPRASAAAEAEVAFRYLGDLDAWGGPELPFALAAGEGTWALWRRSAAPGAAGLGVHAWIAGGRLHATWTPGPGTDPGAAEELAGRFLARLRAVLAGAAGEGADLAAAASPTDFPLAGLGQEDLERIASLMGRVEEQGQR